MSVGDTKEAKDMGCVDITSRERVCLAGRWSRVGAAIGNGIAAVGLAALATTSVAACTAAGGAHELFGAGNAGPDGRSLAVARYEVHAQCPLDLTRPSVRWVDSYEAWARVVARSTAMPPPYRADDTDFNRQAILVVALRPSSKPLGVTLDGREPLRFDDADGRLSVTLRVVTPDDPSPGTVRATVMSMLCVVVWTQGLANVREVVARTSQGEVIAQTRP